MSSPCASAERELCWCRALRDGDGGDRRDQVEVLLEVRALKARRVAAVIAGLQIVDALYLPGEKAAPQRAVGDEADAELAHGWQDVVFRLAASQRVFGLQCGDRVHLVRAPDRVGRCFGEAEVGATVSSIGVLGSTRCR